MTTIMTDTNVLARGWVTAKEAAKATGMSPNVFRVWLARHEEVDRRIIGRSCVVRMDSVFEARRRL
jgi:hypothetical protein